ncbi:MAG: S8 family serine peptidase [Phycisphaerales bacterium]|nr:S8 family serine peptidase [Phycisphaerales bacterium]
MNSKRRVVSVLALATGLAGTAMAQSFNGTPSPWSYMVDGEAISLEVDTTRMACFQAGVVDATVAGPALAAHGLDADTLVPSGSAGWMYAEMVQPAATVRDVAALTRSMAADPAIDFVSPVFLAGTRSLPWIVTRDIIVGFEPGTSQETAEAFLATRVPGGIIEQDLGGMSGVYLLETDLSQAFEVLDLVAVLESDPTVRFAQTDAIWWTMPAFTPNDPQYGSLWGLNQANDEDMDAPEAWDVTTGDSSIMVAVLDDGLDQDHPDMNQVPGFNFTGSGSSGDHETACDGHGTCVASCVSAIINNNLYTVGVAPSCPTIGMKIFNAIEFFGFCFGFLESQDSWIIAGLNQSVTSGARVTNSSWGGGASSSGVNAAFTSSYAQGVLHIAAAGNDGSTTIGWPASLNNVLAVAALASNGTLASFSTSGSGLFGSAPGAGILCLDAMGGEGFGAGDTISVDGTSFAAPYLAGVAALVFSQDPSLTPAEVTDILAETSVDKGASGYDTTYGWGFVNAKNAVDAVEGETPCAGDANSDGVVDVNDVLAVISAYGPCTDCDEDFDDDNVVGVNDILILLEGYGPCP